ncbi:unnamed protein product [Zymoseptoria tritici ST99CH_3D1]|uniref:Ribosome biogenesis protein SLX9 n=1 Tax=Zymoseptoria tritici (strain CBS 115943 / IPO323) TaxID=336722 RepID=F9XGS5_ZYMTI|nr:uncharacterized protein MYCGRDRAFT_110296 [Zymoseptoria tritici IPO323]EGP85984.1 hypothetical protein MYCGRDRAFT_110296 [Zymoseptoria tritici IPO323]SMR57974.1 unnamed protein product [Zymoseptoria tritici ST99CH_3D1]
MAPIRPAKRSSIRARASKSSTSDPRGRYAPPTATDTYSEPAAAALKSSLKPANSNTSHLQDADWRLNKKDKRTVKHNALLNKVRDAGIAKGGAGRKTLKRRRPGKKLVTTMDGLADALPSASEDEGEDEDEWEGLDDEEEMQLDGTTTTKKRRRRKVKVSESDGKMVMKSLKHKPGAARRKAIMEGRERERFGRNLAAMVGTTTGGKENVVAGEADKAKESQKAKWAALRDFIGGTMEKDKAFAKD